MKTRHAACILTAVVLLVLSAAAPAAAAESSCYVHTQNGKPLNVRISPSLSGYRIGTLEDGQLVFVQYYTGDWACISYKWQEGSLSGTEAYVMKKFLISSGSSSRSSSGSSSSSTSKAPAVTGEMGAMNREFDTLRVVTPYVIAARPVRTSGFVNLRFAPSEYAAIAAICYYGHELTVLAVTDGWYQVQDPATGYVGYMMKQYTMAR